MTTRLPTLRQLQYLIALDDHGHFGRAAEASHVTQSTLSAGIAELEALLGASLVERSRRVVRFSALGREVAVKARHILAEAEGLAALTRAAGKPLSGELRMGVIPTIAPFLLPRIMPGLRATWPELRLYLREETTPLACESLRRGGIDCLLLALPYPCGDVESADLGDDRLLLAVDRTQAEAHGRTIAAADIDARHLLLMEDGHCLKDHALAACNRPELRAEAAMLGTSLHTLVQMVDNGLGVTLLPQMALDAGILDGTGVVALPLDSADAFRRIALAWRKNSPRRGELGLLVGALKAAIARPGA